MESYDFSKEMPAGPVPAPVTKQGTFTPDGKQTPNKAGMKDSAIVGPANTNGPHEVGFPKKSSGDSLSKKGEFTSKDDHALYSTAGK